MKKLLVFLLAIAVCLEAVLLVAIFKKEPAAEDIETVITNWGFSDIGELATEEYYFTKVVSHSDDYLTIFGKNIPLTEKRFIFSVDVNVKAGIDFEEIAVLQNDEEKKITIIMPQSRILSSFVDEGTVKIFDETKNIFNPISVEDTTKALDKIASEAKADAIQKGILDKASKNAMDMVKTMVEAGIPEGYSVELK